jgi:hypothetical protein
MKKVDTRGTDLLLGRTIVAIDYECVNQIILKDVAGQMFAITADVRDCVPVLTVEKYHE